MRTARMAVAAALVLASAPALAWKRTEAADRNGIIAGRCLWWAGNEVRYEVNASAANTDGCGTSVAFLQLVRQSLETWGSARTSPGAPVCTGFHFTLTSDVSQVTAVGYRQDGGPNQNLIVVRHGRCEDRPGWSTDPCRSKPGACADQWNCWEYDPVRNDRDWDVGHGPGTIALTTTTFDSSDGRILDTDMELFDGDPTLDGSTLRSTHGFWFTCLDQSAPSQAPLCFTAPSTSCVSMDLGSTVTHEAGHMLGLGHSEVSAATMAPTARIGEITKRVLNVEDDVKGICTIYPTGQPPQTGGGVGESGTTCAALPAPEPKKSTGCATTGGDAAGLLLAVAALARLRLGGAAARLRLRRR